MADAAIVLPLRFRRRACRYTSAIVMLSFEVVWGGDPAPGEPHAPVDL